MADSATSFWQSLPHTWTHDGRDPSFSFEPFGQVWNFYMFSFAAWSELFFFIALEAIAAALISVLLFKFCVKKQGTLLSYVVCYLVVIPMLLLGPYQVFKALKIRNQIFRFALGAVMPITCLFKTSAVAHGFVPDYAKQSTKTFSLFYAFPMMMDRDPKLDKFVPGSMSNVIGHLRMFLALLGANGALFSLCLCIPNIVPPFAQGALPPDSDWYSLSALLYPQEWLPRNILFGITFQILVSLFGEGLMFAQIFVTGYKTRGMMDNPMLSARSPSQFWGSKWNIVIHDVLKIGAYLPLRRHLPRPVAMLGTFAASGLFHEALLWIFSYPIDDSDGCISDASANSSKAQCYQPYLFTTTLFFLHQALFVGLEYSPLGQLPLWSKVPDGLATLLIVSVGATFGHFFAEPYWNSLALENTMMMLPMIKRATPV